MSRARAVGDIGAALVAARRRGVTWKALMARYGLGRTRLYQLWRRALEAEAAAARFPDRTGKNVHEHLRAGQTLASLD